MTASQDDSKSSSQLKLAVGLLMGSKLPKIPTFAFMRHRSYSLTGRDLIPRACISAGACEGEATAEGTTAGTGRTLPQAGVVHS